MATGIIKPLVYRSKYQSKWINTLQNPAHTFRKCLEYLTKAQLNKIRQCWRRWKCNKWRGSACTCSGRSPFFSLPLSTCNTNFSVLHGRFEIRLLDWRLLPSKCDFVMLGRNMIFQRNLLPDCSGEKLSYSEGGDRTLLRKPKKVTVRSSTVSLNFHSVQYHIPIKTGDMCITSHCGAFVQSLLQ